MTQAVVAENPLLEGLRMRRPPEPFALSIFGAQVLADGLKLQRLGVRPVAVPQASEGATYARKLEKADARLDWTQPAQALANKVRAFNPFPMTEAQLAGERVGQPTGLRQRDGERAGTSESV